MRNDPVPWVKCERMEPGGRSTERLFTVRTRYHREHRGAADEWYARDDGAAGWRIRCQVVKATDSGLIVCLPDKSVVEVFAHQVIHVPPNLR